MAGGVNGIGPQGLLALSDDVLGLVLACLPYTDIAVASCVCKRLHALAQDDLKVWQPACERLCGVHTSAQHWVTGGVTFHQLHSAFRRCSSLVGFWRCVEEAPPGGSALVAIEWRPCYLEAVRILSASTGLLPLQKVPFLRAAADEQGLLLCQTPAEWGDAEGLHWGAGGVPRRNSDSALFSLGQQIDAPQRHFSDGGLSEALTGSSGEASGSSACATHLPSRSTERPRRTSTLSSQLQGLTLQPSPPPDSPPPAPCRANRRASSPLPPPPWRGIPPSSRSRASPHGHSAPSTPPRADRAPSERGSVGMSLVSPDHLVLTTLQTLPAVDFPPSRSLEAQAATQASLGAGGSAMFAPLEFGTSPPGSLGYEMFQYWSSRVASPGGQARRSRRRERERAERQGRGPVAAEHYVRIRDWHPAKDRPLQGLWKGVGLARGLDVVLVSYDSQGRISCRGLCNSRQQPFGGVHWVVPPHAARLRPLLGREEEHYLACIASVQEQMDEGKQDCCSGGSTFTEHMLEPPEEVVGYCCTISGLSHCGAQGQHANTYEGEGRLWVYSSGHFGWGLVRERTATCFRPIVELGGLAIGT